jgi:NosR/NirI family transcriptional regulator, nitrous oxide reductase regulator
MHRRPAGPVPFRLLTLAVGLAAIVIGVPGLLAQSGDAALQAQLRRLFPTAQSFTPKGGSPPHFKALGRAAGSDAETVIGYAFWTTELDPLERGYDGPIRILVGMTPQSTLTGIIVANHHEPYGNFSIDLPEFAEQFAGKKISDAFRVGRDIDAVSRATITVSSATRAVRNSARRVAKQILASGN